MKSDAEEWRDIPGLPDYRISNLGRLLSKARRDAAGRFRRERIHKLEATNSGGYVKTRLTLDGKKVNVAIHRLVALAFLGEPPKGCVVCHNNGIANDNRLVNLRYDTPAANNRDRDTHGTLPRGEGACWAKLTESKVREMLALKGVVPTAVIAERFGVSTSAASSVLWGHSWRNVYDTTDAAERSGFPRGAASRQVAMRLRAQNDDDGSRRIAR